MSLALDDLEFGPPTTHVYNPLNYARDPSEQYLDLAGQSADTRLFYEYRDNIWHEPEMKIKLTNNSKRRLYCMLLDLTDSFEISSEGLLAGGGE